MVALCDIQPGAQVRVHNQMAAARLNGMLGAVGDWDVRYGRWHVVLQDGSRKRFRPADVQAYADDPPPACPVTGDCKACKDCIRGAVYITSWGGATVHPSCVPPGGF